MCNELSEAITFLAVVAQLVEHWLPKPRVAGSSPVYRSNKYNVSRFEGRFFIWFPKPRVAGCSLRSRLAGASTSTAPTNITSLVLRDVFLFGFPSERVAGCSLRSRLAGASPVYRSFYKKADMQMHICFFFVFLLFVFLLLVHV